MDQLVPPDQHDAFGIRINRDQSPWLANGLPWVTILLASLSPLSPIIAPAPVLPPLAFMLLVAWRLLRPRVLPLWAGFPLGLFDDLYSGQPFGSGILLFSLTMIALELVDARFPWRNFWQNWGAACMMIVAYLMIAGLVSGAQLTFVQLQVLLPQILLAIMLFPLLASLVALFDQVRLLRIRRLD